MDIETYQVTSEVHGNGTFCFWEGKCVTLYIRGSKEANEYWKKKLKEE